MAEVESGSGIEIVPADKLHKRLASCDYWKYAERGLHSKGVDRNKFIIELPSYMNPHTNKYTNYWKEQKRKCIEGYWVEGKWMPGNLYFYTNFCMILLNLPNSKGKSLGSPFLRDIEWEKAYVYMESRGFSGFDGDDTITCLHIVKELEELSNKDKEQYKRKLELAIIPPTAYKKDGKFKTFVHPRDYLRRIHPKNYGKPLYENNASNVVDIQARRMGKDLHEDSLLHYIDGSKRVIKNVKVGDIIFGGDGKPTTILERIDFDDQLQYEVTLRDGRTVTCGGGHLWTVRDRKTEEEVTLELDNFRTEFFYDYDCSIKHYKYDIPSYLPELGVSWCAIHDIKPLDIKPSVCIRVDNKDSLFLVNDYVVTHNSWGSAGSMIVHNYLFDGATDYDMFLNAKNTGTIPSSETLVGAIDSKYSGDLLNKTKLILENLKGNMTFNGIERPSPFAKQSRGSLMPGKFLEAAFDQKLPGGWVTKGSRSKIHHRTFADNPLAGNGTGPNLIVLEEVGFFSNIIETFSALTDATKDGLNKFGTIYATGTGGDMGKGVSEGIKDMFFHPERYDALCFEDIWEGNGNVGFFIPYQFKFDEYRDSNGVIDLSRASMFTEDKREKLLNQKDRYKYEAEIQNNPDVPTEAFHVSNSNIFPTAELMEQRGWVQSAIQTDGLVQGQCGELFIKPDTANEVIWKPDLKGKLVPCKYNMQKTDDTTGCVQIWEHPKKDNEGNIPFGLYIAGTDPYDQDQSTTTSLGSTYIYKTFGGLDQINHWLVAEYTARPDTAHEHHENVRKLLMYYNAKDLYENERNTLKYHLEFKRCLHLLKKTPTILKATEGSKVNRQYGIHMTKDIKLEMEMYLRDWLMEEDQDGKLNLNKIYSLPLLDELINYNDTGNFDRIIAMLLVITHKLDNYKVRVDMVKETKVDAFFDNLENYFTNNPTQNTNYRY